MTLYDLAQRFVGDLRELPGEAHDPFIQFCFTKCGWSADTPDETPWCSAWVNGLAWLLRLPRSKSAAARSWLHVGQTVALREARVGYDLVVLKRGTNPAQGHVGLFAGYQADTRRVSLLSGNDADTVTVREYPEADVLGVRRLAPVTA